MNAPTLRSAIARQRWDIVAHLLLYGLIAVQTNGHRPPAGSIGSEAARQPSPKRAGRPRGA